MGQFFFLRSERINNPFVTTQWRMIKWWLSRSKHILVDGDDTGSRRSFCGKCRLGKVTEYQLNLSNMLFFMKPERFGRHFWSFARHNFPPEAINESSLVWEICRPAMWCDMSCEFWQIWLSIVLGTLGLPVHPDVQLSITVHTHFSTLRKKTQVDDLLQGCVQLTFK